MSTEEKYDMYIAYTIIGFIDSHIPFLNHCQTILGQRIWVSATNSNFLIIICLQSEFV